MMIWSRWAIALVVLSMSSFVHAQAGGSVDIRQTGVTEPVVTKDPRKQVPKVSETFKWKTSEYGPCEIPRKWVPGPWSKCDSTECEKGKQTRNVMCEKVPSVKRRVVTCVNERDVRVADNNCQGTKPAETTPCTEECSAATKPVAEQECPAAKKVCVKEPTKAKGKGRWTFVEQYTVQGCQQTNPAGTVKTPHGEACENEGEERRVMWGASNAAVHLPSQKTSYCAADQGPVIQNIYRCIVCASGKFVEENFTNNRPEDPNMHGATADVRRFKCADGAPDGGPSSGEDGGVKGVK